MTGVRLYRWILSPAKTFLFGPLGGCRFEPSCSAYALESLRLHGAMKGSLAGGEANLPVSSLGRLRRRPGAPRELEALRCLLLHNIAGQSLCPEPRSAIPTKISWIAKPLLCSLSAFW